LVKLNLISTVMTPYSGKVTPASTSTVVCNTVISWKLLISKQDDTALWQMYASAMGHSPDQVTPEAEKQSLLRTLLASPGVRGRREGAIQYLEYVNRTLHDPDAVQIGVRCFECCFVSQILTALLVVASFDAPRETFNAKVLNSITSKFFTILRGPIIFRQGATCGTSISLAQALPQASALIGPQKASIL
jgi:hypothetical protein